MTKATSNEVSAPQGHHHGPTLLHRKKSTRKCNVSVHCAADPPPIPITTVPRGSAMAEQTRSYSAGLDEKRTSQPGEKAGSHLSTNPIRRAFKRLFVRRSKDITAHTTQPLKAQYAHHGYHRSEPLVVAPDAAKDQDQRKSDIPQRTLSINVKATEAQAQHGRSNYALEFPRSAKLKPLNLGTPAIAPPTQIKRRITLSSMPRNAEEEGNPLPASRAGAVSPDAPPVPSLEGLNIYNTATTAPSTPRPTYPTSRRKSRSESNLRENDRAAVAQKWSDQIKDWRSSSVHQNGQVSASGASSLPASLPPSRGRDTVAAPPKREGPTECAREASRSRKPAPPEETPQPKLPSPGIRARSEAPQRSRPSRDLETRVAHLEAGLQTFQQALQQLAAQRRQHSDVSSARHKAEICRSPSVLADMIQSESPHNWTGLSSTTLNNSTPLSLADVKHDPSNSPDNVNVEKCPKPDSPPTKAAPIVQSLYGMLAQERFSRQKLEENLKGLQDDLDELRCYVSASESRIPSGNYYLRNGAIEDGDDDEERLRRHIQSAHQKWQNGSGGEATRRRYSKSLDRVDSFGNESDADVEDEQENYHSVMESETEDEDDVMF